MTNRTYNLMVVIGVFALMVWASAFLSGCNTIPLTNNDARPLNRIYSGFELITQLHVECHSLVVDGVITQQQVNDYVFPVLEEAESLFNAAEIAYKAGDIGDASNKRNQATFILLRVKDQLKRFRGAQ